MSTSFQQKTAFASAPTASPSSPLLWVPLDEVRQAWANFGAEALSCPALVATSNAFLALSWETSALRHHGMACQEQQRGGLSQEAARWLDRVVQDLDEAVRDWQCVQLWLERLVTTSSNKTAQARTEPIEQVRALSEQSAAQQQRLRHLIGQVRHEQGACGRGGQVGAPVTPAITVNATAAIPAAAVQGEERVTWPSN